MENGQTPATPEPSISDLRKLIAGEPVTEPAAPAADPAPEAQPAKTEPAPEPDAVQDPTDGTRDEQGRFKPADPEPVPPGVQKRIDKAVKAQREAERRATELETKLANNQGARPAEPNAQPAQKPAGPPEAKDFDSYEKYVVALTDYTVTQREQQSAAATQQRETENAQRAAIEKHNERLREAEKAPDWSDIMDAAKDIPISRDVHIAIVESEMGPQIVRHLVEHPEDAARIAKLSPARQLVEIGKIEALKTPASSPVKPAAGKPLPRPPATVGGSHAPAKTDLNDPNLSMADFKREAAKLLAR